MTAYVWELVPAHQPLFPKQMERTMSQIDIPWAAAPTHSGLMRRCRDALVCAFRHVTEEWIVRRAIAELQGLDDHMLRDIGLTRSEIESCVRHGQGKQL